MTTSDRAARLWGAGTIEAAFPEGDRTVVPWPAAGTTKDERYRWPERAMAVATGAPHVVDLDPRVLRATQSWVVRHHVAHYLTDEWERTGTTSADRGRTINRWPLVHVDAAGQHILFGGHHRATAALLQARPLRARVLRTDPDDPLAVLPRLLVSPHDHLAVPATRCTDPADAAERITAGATVVVADLELARAVLVAAGHPPERIEDRLAVAQGREAHIDG